LHQAGDLYELDAKLRCQKVKAACFISLNPKYWKEEQKYLGRTRITLAMKGAHMQHTL
jgi:hypothetical protein